MPKLTKSLPKYRKHKASGQAVVTIQGRDVYLGPHGSKISRIEYDRVVSEWLAAGRPEASTDCDLTIVELISAYWRFAKSYYVKGGRPTSELMCIKAALRLLKQNYGHTRAVEFGPRSLKAIRQKMVDAGLARSTINANVFKIRRVFRWAVRRN